MDQALINNTTALMPVMGIQDAIARYNAVIEFTKRVMKPGKDYGSVPGTGTKPTLLKPGAEKLCSLFGLCPEFVVTDKIVDFTAGLFYFEHRCDLYHNGVKVGSGIGSCNSKEKKYRYRNITEKQATDDDKARAIRVEEKSGQYGKYKVYVVENLEPFDLVNTINKMSQKRALVAATLIAANASEFFTQDVEDMDFIEGEYHEAPTAPEQPAPQPKPKAKPSPEQQEELTLEVALNMRTPKGKQLGELTDEQLQFLIDKATNGLNAAAVLVLNSRKEAQG